MRKFTCSVPIRFGDIDRAGVAYYPKLFDHCHVAFEEFFAKALGMPYPTVLQKNRLGFPTVSVGAEFSRPLRFGDVLKVEVSVGRIGRSSVEFRYRASVGRARRAAFEVRSVTVCVDMRTFRPRPVPAPLRKRLSRFLVATGTPGAVRT